MSQKERIDLSLLLPHVTDDSDSCIHRLTEMLRAKKGITHVHFKSQPHSSRIELCIHFDEQNVSISEVRDYAQRAGLSLEQRYAHLFDNTAPMPARLARLRSEQLAVVPGILEAMVVANGTIRIEYDKSLLSEAVVRSHLEQILKHASSRELPSNPESRENGPNSASPSSIAEKHKHDPNEQPHDHEHHSSIGGINVELVCSCAAGVCVAIAWLLSFFDAIPEVVSIGLYIIAYALTGWFMLREALERLWLGRFEIDTLMLVAAGGAAYLGKWAEGALLLLLFSMGHALESFAMGRAKRAIEALTSLAPAVATVQREGRWIEVPVESLTVGESVAIKPNERVSADGFVVNGTSSVNQAPVTGESVPVDKLPVEDIQEASTNPDKLPPQNRVYAGTINGAKALEIQVTRTSAENTLSRIVKMVSEAETRTSPTQTFTRKIEKYFVPCVLVFDLVLLFAWVVISEPFSASLYRAMSVLVAASPCALAISTPSAVLAGIARAARGGVLIKGGGPLESLGTIRVIAFDKTGTLTEGKPRLTDVLPAENVLPERLLAVAIAVETLSDHPLASAIVRDAKTKIGDMAIPRAVDIEGIVGRGVKAKLDGVDVFIGKETLFADGASPIPTPILAAIEKLKNDGRTTMIVKLGEQFLGVLGVMDTPREAARGVISDLRSLGVQRMFMLSGDNQQVADAVAKSVGLEEAKGDLMPDDKVRVIQTLSTEGGVAMVGDGVNDAPAMAGATVGIAMGAAGSDVALETADVALMADDLRHLPFVVGLSRKTRAIIQQNLWISLGMVAFLLPATTFGLSLGPAVVLHEGSTLVVVANALRLLSYEQRPR